MDPLWERLRTSVTFTLKLIVGLAIVRWALNNFWGIQVTIPVIDPVVAAVGRWIIGSLNYLIPR